MNYYLGKEKRSEGLNRDSWFLAAKELMVYLVDAFPLMPFSPPILQSTYKTIIFCEENDGINVGSSCNHSD